MSGTSGGFTVNPGALDYFSFSTITNPQISGWTFSVTVTAEDAYGNTVTSYSGTPSLSCAESISPNVMDAFVNGVGSATVSVTNAGSGVTITATDGTHMGTSNSFMVEPTISATSGGNGAISPSGTFPVTYGGNQSFTITPNTGYSVAEVLVNGVSVGAVSSYTVTNVQAYCNIYAEFEPKSASTSTSTSTSTATPTSLPTTSPTPTASSPATSKKTASTITPTPAPQASSPPTPTQKNTPLPTQNPVLSINSTQLNSSEEAIFGAAAGLIFVAIIAFLLIFQKRLKFEDNTSEETDLED